MIRLATLIALLLSSSASADEALSVGDIRQEIRTALGKNITEVDTRAGRFSFPGYPKLSVDGEDPPIGPAVGKYDDASAREIRQWVTRSKADWVTMIVPSDSPADTFIKVCALLNQLGVGFTVCDLTEVPGRRFEHLTLFAGSLRDIRFTGKVQRLPQGKPPSIKPDKSR